MNQYKYPFTARLRKNTRSAIENTIPISLFNRGLAGKIFDEVKRYGAKVVMKNNTPECVLLSPEEYIQLLDNLGVRHIRFGLTSKIGRNSTCANDWDLEYDDCIRFDKILEQLKKEYPHIHFSELGWDYHFNNNFPIKDHYTIGCEAGKRVLVVSERGFVRPCVYLPAQYFERTSWDEYFTLITNGELLDTVPCVANCLEDFQKTGKSISQICPRAFV